MKNLATSASLIAILLSLPLSADESPFANALEAGWKGEKTCELLQETELVRMVRCTFPPGVGHERHFHPPHVGYTLQGSSMQITDANGVREIEVKSFGSWKSKGVVWHEAINIGDTTAQYLIVEQKQ